MTTSLEPSSSVSGSLVHPEGERCRWCRAEPATTVVYSWPTCIACASSPRIRISRYLKSMTPWKASQGVL